MKILKISLLALAISSLSLLTHSCGGSQKEENPLADSLSNLNGELNGQLSEKEAALQEFVASFNEIQDNLNAIKDKEKIISKSSQEGDLKSKEGQIQEDIQAIYDLLAKNKNRIGSLTSKLKKSNSKIAGLEQMIATLQAQIDSKDGEISDLKSQLESKNIELSNIQMNLESIEAESTSKTEKLNTVYYTIGTSKELKEKNIISKEGGFIGIGKSTTVKSDFNKDYFTKTDAAQITEITISAKKAKVISNHPTSSYKLVGDKTIEKLEILNSEEFWSNSKYLVIIVE